MRHIKCSVCEMDFPVQDNVTTDPKTYVCDNCRLNARVPRRITPQMIVTAVPWQPSDLKCDKCGIGLWEHVFMIRTDREVIPLTGGDEPVQKDSPLIKGATSSICHFECPNPDCESTWGKLPSHKHSYIFLRPPWALPDLEDAPDLALLSTDQKFEEWHRRWWATYSKLTNPRTAGKGTKFSFVKAGLEGVSAVKARADGLFRSLANRWKRKG